MSRNARIILIVLLVVIVVLFFAGVIVGANNGVGGLSLDGVISAFSGLFPTPLVGIDEINASPGNCLDPHLQRIIVPSGGSCDLEIAESSANIRALKLQIASGQGVHLELTGDPVEDKPLVVKTDLPKDGNNQVTLNIFQAGGSLIIDSCTANGASACILDLVH